MELTAFAGRYLIVIIKIIYRALDRIEGGSETVGYANQELRLDDV